MAGLDSFREAPRRDDLDRYLSTNQAFYGPFRSVTANNITLNFVTPFIAAEGSLLPWLRYNVGWRRDQIRFDNQDLLVPQNSFNKWVGINSPKATLSILPPDRLWLPSVALSFGQAFFTNDPRIGAGLQEGSLVSQSHSYQMVVSKTVLKTDLRVTLGHVTQEASLAKIDPDTGLQFDDGPSVNRYMTVSARRYFGAGLLQASFSKADARDLSDGLPVPEAPRLIYDVLGTLDRLPFHLHARAEFEEVGRKPLGDGFASVPVREFRGALMRSFHDGRLQTGVQFQIASGYTGQTTEVLALPGEGEAFERVVGVYHSFLRDAVVQLSLSDASGQATSSARVASSRAGVIARMPDFRKVQPAKFSPSRRSAISHNTVASDPVTERLGPRSTPTRTALRRCAST